MAVILHVFADPSTDSVTISWEADISGIGELSYGTEASNKPNVLRDDINAVAHSIRITNLNPDTDYFYTVANVDPDSGDSASRDGQIHTVPLVSGAQLTQPDALPRRVGNGESSTLSVRVKKQGSPVANVVVEFKIRSDSQGSGEISSSALPPGQTGKSQSDAQGVAKVTFKGGNEGIVRVDASSPSATGGPVVAVVVGDA